jgi:pyruvate kinase
MHAHKRGRKTVIVCTLGPASLRPATLDAMLKVGMDVARLNFSHGTPESMSQAMALVRAAFSRAGKPVQVLADLPGPKVRIGEVKGGALTLKAGDSLLLTSQPCLGTAKRISVEYPHLGRSLKKGGLVFLNDGFMQLKAEKVQGGQALCTVLVGGELRSRKGFALPGVRLPLYPPTAQDLELLRFALSLGIGWFGASFVSSARELKAFRAAAPHPIQLVAKLERAEALAHATELCKEADAIMIARGDLGVNLPLEEVPLAQKALTRLANVHHAFTITATQMLESMTSNSRPTRAEAADVANAVLDGSEAVMLSEETAAGQYPVEAVAWMDRIARAAERARRPDGKVRYRLG